MLSKLLKPRMRGVFRHALSSFGPLLAAHGYGTAAYWEIWVGILFAALAFYDSWTAPEKRDV